MKFAEDIFPTFQAIPYWDSVMDGYLPDPRASVMFTRDFIGEADLNGFVVTGPFAYWRTLEGRPAITRHGVSVPFFLYSI